MPRDGDFKRHVRRRMEETGERYTRAREILRSPPPIKWDLTGDARAAYEVSAEADAAQPGGRVDVLRSTGDPGRSFGAMVSRVAAEPYRGGRARFAARVRAEAGQGAWTGLWMRVDSATETLEFDNMQGRPLRGTTGWRDVEVILNIAPEAEQIFFGLILTGRGTVRMAGARLEQAPPRALPTGQPMVDGWSLAGSRADAYQLLKDEALVLRCTADPEGGFGTMMRTTATATRVQQRMRLAASIRGSGVEGWAGLWMRVDDAHGQGVAFDNMQDRALRGTFDWTPVEVVLDVPTDARAVAHGVLLAGRGELKVAGIRLETVDESVPTTGWGLPHGWTLGGSNPEAYDIKLERGGRAGSMWSVADPGDGFGTLMLQVPADAPDRRVRFRASLRAEGSHGTVALWMRADNDQQQLVIVNHPEPSLKAPFDWREEAAELTIPETATVLAFGVILAGEGRVDIKEVELELVD
jgi:hypothetical protein